MKPIDFRLATFADLKSRLAGGRAIVLGAWLTHGPGTTAEVCARSGLSILSFRPRSTELFQLGFICLADRQPSKGEGVYRVRQDDELITWCAQERQAATPHQAELAFR
jgi:hypothetical protein